MEKIPTAEVVLLYLIPNAKEAMTITQWNNAINAITQHGVYYFNKGYEEGYKDSSKEAYKEITEHYQPNK